MPPGRVSLGNEILLALRWLERKMDIWLWRESMSLWYVHKQNVTTAVFQDIHPFFNQHSTDPVTKTGRMHLGT